MEAYLGYDFVRLSSDGKLGLIPTRDANGGLGQFVWNFGGRGFGAAFEAGAVTNSTINLNHIDATVSHVVIGPRYKFMRHDAKWQPFVQVLFGGAYSTASTQISAVTVVNPLVNINPLIPVGQNVTARLVASRRSFAMVAGGGLDWKISKHMQIRPFEFDYFQVEPETLIEGPGGRTGNKSNWRYSAGANFTFGAQ
jgi:hypothetical protein